MKDANSDRQKSAILNFNDFYAGTECVGNITDLMETSLDQLGKCGLTLRDVLSQFNIRASNRPVELRAKVLPEPQIEFGNRSALLKNGSWQVKGNRFSK